MSKARTKEATSLERRTIGHYIASSTFPQRCVCVRPAGGGGRPGMEGCGLSLGGRSGGGGGGGLSHRRSMNEST